MILEVKKQNNQFVLCNFPKANEHYYIDIKAEAISAYKANTLSQKTATKNHSNAIEALNKILNTNPNNDFIKRKIAMLSKPKTNKTGLTDNEALYLALSDKYDL